jgi:hypothetical protein
MSYLNQSLIVFVISLLPYALISWVYIALTEAGARDFWIAIGVLLLIRLFFAVIESFGAFLLWRIYGRRVTTDKLVAILRSSGFPMRVYAHDDFSNYVDRIKTDPAASPALRTAAWQLESMLTQHDEAGIFAGLRMRAAADAALEIYSPRAAAPQFNAG